MCWRGFFGQMVWISFKIGNRAFGSQQIIYNYIKIYLDVDKKWGVTCVLNHNDIVD